MPHTARCRDNFGLRAALAACAVAVAAASALADAPKGVGYELAAPPLKVFDRLGELKMGPAPRLAEGERELLARAWGRRGKGPMGERELLEAMLLASGVEKAEARRKYHRLYEGLAVKARVAVKGAKTDRERGERLMKFLHAGVMSKGYEAEQSSLAAVFDTGKYNCVSSAALYYLVGTRLGLDLRGVAIPGSSWQAGHAALDLVVGKARVQVEPTNPDGFDWEVKSKRPGVVVFGLVPDRKQASEVDGPGLAAMIYSNRGVALMRQKAPRPLEAARCYLAALALGPTSATATRNLTALFVNWGPQLIEQKRYEDAVRVMAFGLSVAPKSREMQNNHRVAWHRHIEATLEAGKDAEAVALIGRAAKAVPDERDFQRAAEMFVRHGYARKEKGGWEAGLAVVARGLKVLPEGERKRLREWRVSQLRQWSQERLEKKDVEGSLKVMARAYALDGKDREVRSGIGYHTQSALGIVEGKSGVAAMARHFAELRKKFPDVDEVAERGAAHAERAVLKLAEGKKFADAVRAVEVYRALLAKPEQRARAGGLAYDLWARHLAEKKEWKAALDKYAEGLKAYPKHDRLTGNAVATVDQWASPAIRKKDWDEAIRIYDVGLGYLKDSSHLKHNKDYCQRMKEKS